LCSLRECGRRLGPTPAFSGCPPKKGSTPPSIYVKIRRSGCRPTASWPLWRSSKCHCSCR
jgi:hypothetical protein